MGKNKKRKLNPASNGDKVSHSVTKSKKLAKPTPTKKAEPTIPFQAEDRILLVGEGDFSFAHSIVAHHGCCDVTATCFDSEPELREKYDPQVATYLQYLEEEGQTVLSGVNATNLPQDKQLKKLQAGGGQWNVVIFNFPHVGGKSKDVNRQVRFNQELLVSFFRAAAPLLAPGGTIIVTLFEGEPYTLWNIRDLARHSGLEVQRSFKFMAEAYPGYSHARTLGNIQGGGGWKGEERESRSFVFQKKAVTLGIGGDAIHASRQGLVAGGGGKRKKGGEEDDSDSDD